MAQANVEPAGYGRAMRGALIWFGAALVLAGAELLGAEFFMLMLATGALAAAVTALVTGDAILLPAIVFVLVSVAMVVLVRPMLVRRLLTSPPAKVGVARIVGAPAIVLEEVTQGHGTAKVGGDTWTARIHDGVAPLPAGTEARVLEVRGATVYIERA